MASVKPGWGWQSFLQWGREATWHTFPTMTNRMPLSTMNARPDHARVRPKILNGSMAQPAVVQTYKRCLFTLEIPLTYNGLAMWFDAFMGTSTYGSNGGATTGASPYTHTWTGFKNLLNSFGLEVGMGDIPTGKVEKLTGVKVMKATIKCSAGSIGADAAIASLVLECVGYQLTDNATPTTLGSGTAATVDSSGIVYVLGSQMTVNNNLSGSTAERTIDWQLEIDTMLNAERVLLEGSGFISEPHRRARPLVTLTITEEFQTKTALDAYIANTKAGAAGIQTTFTNGTSILDFQMGGAIMQAPEHPVTGDDYLRQKLVYVAEDSGSGDTLQIVMTNFMSTITAVS